MTTMREIFNINQDRLLTSVFKYSKFFLQKTHSNEDRHSLTPTASTPRPVIATIPVPNSNVAQAQTKQPIANALNRIAEQDIWDNFGATVAQGLREISVPSIQQEAAQVIMADLFRFTTKEREVTGGAASANST